ncbi:hypothetical protein [Botryobacter ruber]|uniref:hypothetical protein n=1 Tax=Botryobacter ruber TaxID=2171629 RepID=UPI000E0A787D|nr:hypothetical protein [Botryobacter ruber]
MRKVVTSCVVFLLLATVFFIYTVFNNMVSLKYETDEPGACISKITGIDLCEAIKFHKIAALASLLLAIALLYYREFFMEKK